jgi:hypothetical protein
MCDVCNKVRVYVYGMNFCFDKLLLGEISAYCIQCVC